MSKKDHRLGVREANLVDRHLKLEETKLQNIKTAIWKIDQVLG